MFRSWYPPAVRSEIDAYLAGLSREYAVPVIDAHAWVGDGVFADGHHLLPAGADAFTERFGRDALQPLLEGRAGPAQALWRSRGGDADGPR